MFTPLEAAKEMFRIQNGGKKKRGRKPVFSANQFYPWKIEREMKDSVSKILADVAERLSVAALFGFQLDDLDELDVTGVTLPADVESTARKIFDKTEAFVGSGMDMFSEKTIGRRIGYYAQNSDLRETFVKNFVQTCKSAGEDMKKEMAAAIYRKKMFPDESGKSLVKELREINVKYTKSKATFIARNETGNLNAAIGRRQQENAGFSMYEWMSMRDGVTRDAHRNLDGIICRWDDDSIYSDDGGKTWKKRTAGMFIGQPGQDFNCRCSALPFDPELEIDYSVKEQASEPEAPKEPTPLEKAREEAKAAVEQAEKAEERAKEAVRSEQKVKFEFEKLEKKLIRETEKAAQAVKQTVVVERRAVRIFATLKTMRETASKILAKVEFPDEVWETENGVRISKRRIDKSKKSKNEESKFKKEKNIAMILARGGHTVWLLPEEKIGEKNPDAIVDGLIFDFKQIKFKQIEHRFSEALEQADNVVLQLEGEDFDIRRVFGKLRKYVKNRAGKLILIFGKKIVIADFKDIK